MSVAIQRAGLADWERWKAIRLRALAEAPDAFGSTLARERGFDDALWRERVGNPESGLFLATRSGADVGLVATMAYRGKAPGSAGLFSMWVAPEARGAGVGAALIARAVDWTRERGFDKLYLDVGDANAPAIALYAKLGFVPTGVTGSLDPPRTHILEHERVLEL